MKNKGNLEKNILIVKELLNDIENEFVEATKNNNDNDEYLVYNTSLINRNRKIINDKLKELEQY